jgi:maleate cis-trans isomerase
MKCVELDIPYITTMTATKAAVKAIKALKNNKISVNSLTDYHIEFNR